MPVYTSCLPFYFLLAMLWSTVEAFAPTAGEFDHCWYGNPLAKQSNLLPPEHFTMPSSNGIPSALPPDIRQECNLPQYPSTLLSNPSLLEYANLILPSTGFPNSPNSFLAPGPGGSSEIHQGVHEFVPLLIQPPLPSHVGDGSIFGLDQIFSNQNERLLVPEIGGSSESHQSDHEFVSSLIHPPFPPHVEDGSIFGLDQIFSNQNERLLVPEIGGSSESHQGVHEFVSSLIQTPSPSHVGDGSMFGLDQGFSSQNELNQNFVGINNAIPEDIFSTKSSRSSTGPSEDELTTTAAVPSLEQKTEPGFSLPSSILPSGQVVGSLINEFRSRFKQFQQSPENWVRPNGQMVPHPSLPYMLGARLQAYPGQVSRVLVAPNGPKQKPHTILTLYTFLIGCVYDLHTTELKQLNIPASEHSLQHRKLLKWLDNEIHSPARGLPVFGTLTSPLSLKVGEEEFGTMQLKLIDYFSIANSQKYKLAPKMASIALETFQGQHMDDYVILMQPSKAIEEKSIKNPTDPNFQKIHSYLSKVPYSRTLTPRFQGTSAKLLSACRLLFEVKMEKLHVTQVSGHITSCHPHWPVAVYYPRNNPALKTLRIVGDGKTKMIASRKLQRMFYTLTGLAQYLHTQLLKKWEMRADYAEIMFRSFFTWLMDEIFEPHNSLPILGLVDIAGNAAPWDLPGHNPASSFGTVQLVLIRYFSQKEHRQNQKEHRQSMKDTVAFLLATWYQSNPPNDGSKYFKHVHQSLGSISGSQLKRNVKKV
ncbi:hypothetical protein KEM48_005383 [Puccinia striiformis f. sp. tritici PST-130]|nr:hypothetical protein Pst134EB_028450 [Puccinia striiformis f. sp. tritici]KAI9616126.1 hypothetical protein KEM48_005383 [Puccinia striiformis f. sp. tritici PST-130]